MKSIFVSATGTDVGKTFVSAGIIRALKSKGKKVCYYKPIESGGIKTEVGYLSGDAKWVSKYSECEDIYNDYCFERPMSPHLASRLENRVINPDVIKEHYNKLLKEYEFVLVEGAGGLSVPLIEYDYMVYDLVKDLNMQLLIVADAGLGSINHTTLTIALADKLGIEVKGIILNNYNDGIIHRENVRAIKEITKKPIIMTIPCMNVENDKLLFQDYFESECPIEYILGE